MLHLPCRLHYESAPDRAVRGRLTVPSGRVGLRAPGSRSLLFQVLYHDSRRQASGCHRRSVRD
ncbi:hypothetical protein PHAMO_10257 [Magnetospirillum molischianum DSM 120]|uniref:Uncharacterized protein n=1 Tax=Magnetospirillum molischianum DSM 120 TaxID=1150626 RepID=H8FN94_MAGML|nr:hypothetical protein PHAMO_10257 [Magnetospirillum molischianum DSM 120]